MPVQIDAFAEKRRQSPNLMQVAEAEVEVLVCQKLIETIRCQACGSAQSELRETGIVIAERRAARSHTINRAGFAYGKETKESRFRGRESFSPTGIRINPAKITQQC